MKLAPKRELNSRLSPGNGECEFPAWEVPHLRAVVGRVEVEAESLA